MTTLDWIILAYIALAAFNGFRSGLIHMVGSILGVFFGAVIAGRWYEGFGSWLGTFVFTDITIAKVVGFTIILLIFNRIFGLAFMLLNKVLRIATIIPGISGLNRLGGALFGFIEGVLIAGVVLFVATKFDVGPGWRDALAHSFLVPILTGVSQIVTPLLPGALKSLQSVIGKSL